MNNLKNSFQCSWKELKLPRTIAITALFIAINVVMDMVGLRIELTKELRVSFGFLTHAMVGMMFGPVVGGVAGGVGDIICYIVRPIGAYFPGFTLTAILGGVIYGILLYKKTITPIRVILTKGFVSLVLNVCLNSIWLKILYGNALFLMLPTRIIKNVVLLPIEAFMLFTVALLVQRSMRVFVNNNG